MSLTVSTQSLLEEHGLGNEETATLLTQHTISELREPALRAEVYERVDMKENLMMEDFSMSYVHVILDALIESLEGQAL